MSARSRHRRRPTSLLAVATALTLGAITATAAPALAARPVQTAAPSPTAVEQRYGLDGGPAAVLTSDEPDAAEGPVTVYRPADMTTDRFANPIVTWANGTGTTCDTYDRVLRHFASWGIVVVCANNSQTGYGTEVWAAARYMIAQNSTPGSVFRGQLDTRRVASSGHSQGATGALNANVLSDGVVTSTAVFALPDPIYANPKEHLPDTSRVRNPVLLLSGTFDFLTNQNEQLNWFNKLNTPAARAAVRFKGHNGMVEASAPYATAWLLYTLRGDAVARSAFVSTDGVEPEVSRNPGWANWTAKGLR